MSEETGTGTPPDHTVIMLQIEAALLPGWFDEVRKICKRNNIRRMGVLEKPEEWLVYCEVPKDGVEAFHKDLADTWALYPESKGVN